jgi:hypothetical protein
MSLSSKASEIRRLITFFEAEAAHFHDIELSTFSVTQTSARISRKFKSPNHNIMLWQYYGAIQNENDREHLAANIKYSNFKWGLRGATLSSFAVIEGDACPWFLRIAERAGALFDEGEALEIKSRVTKELAKDEKSKSPEVTPVVVTNDNLLAIWINYLLFHISQTNPGRERAQKIQPDPFTLSLLALERLAETYAIGKIDRSTRMLNTINFKVALSFPGEKRGYVSEVASHLRSSFGSDAVFYDYDYQAQLARPNLDLLLQDIYRYKSNLVVVFLCEEYTKKQWCGLEWRAIRDIIKSRADDQLMFVRFDNAKVDGFFSIDGYIDANAFSAKEVASFIEQRIDVLPAKDVQG